LSENVGNLISDLRAHINTISPPTLTATRNGNTVYKRGNTPDITITVGVNRPLEAPLALQSCQKAVKETVGYTGFSRDDGIYEEGEQVLVYSYDPSFTVYSYEIPAGISQITVEFSQFYHTTGNGKLSAIVIPVIKSENNFVTACASSEVRFEFNGQVVNGHSQSDDIYSDVQALGGKLTITWPDDKQVSHILINSDATSDTDAPNATCVLDTQTGRQWSYPWKPSYGGINLPHNETAKIKIVNEEDSSLVYAEKAVTCVFAENIYYGTSGSDNCTALETLDNYKTLLSAGHPTTLNFEGTNTYCYYFYPANYGTPTISAGGFVGGFSKLAKPCNIDNISYNIYRSNQTLSSVTINIK
jgi:hypothetical protein